MNTVNTSKIRVGDKVMELPEIEELSRPFVYAWCRKGEYLYIGATSQGFRRILSHNILNVVEPFQPGDCFEFWYCDTETETFALEFELIKFHKPKYNTPSNRGKQQRYVRAKRVRCVKCMMLHKGDKDQPCWLCKAKEANQLSPTSAMKVSLH